MLVVHGAFGVGKTVAVAAWASTAQAGRGVWFTVDDAAATRRAFWSALADQLSDAEIEPLGATLAESLRTLDPDADLRRVLVRAFARLRGELTIVLDDFWSIADDRIRDDLLTVLQSAPGLRAVVMTRRVDAFDSASTRLALVPTLLGPDALHLSPAEVAEAVARAGLDDPEGEVAASLMRVAGGHPMLTAGVALELSRGGAPRTAESLDARVSRAGAALLGELVFSRASAMVEGRSALFCSVPPVLTDGLAHELTASDRAGELLARFERDGLGGWTDDALGRVFAFLPLVRSALRAELDAQLPGEVARLSCIAARWCNDHARPLPALSLALDSGDLDVVAEVVLQQWDILLYSHLAEGIALLDSLPMRKLTRQPLIAMWLAIAYNTSQLHKVRAFELFALATASARLRRDREPAPMKALLYLLESSAQRVLGRGQAALVAADKGFALVEELSLDDRESLGSLLPVLLNQGGLAHLYAGHPQSALRMFEFSMVRSGRGRDFRGVHAPSLIAGVHAIRGNMRDAARMVEQIRAGDWTEEELNGYRGALLHIAEGQSALERFDFAQAREHVEVMAPHLPTIEHWPLFAHIQAMALLGQGGAHAALASMDAEVAKHSRVTTSVGRVRVDTTRALLRVATGDLATAERLLKAHPRKALPIALEWARLELSRGRPEEAANVLLAAEIPADESVRLRAELHVLRASAELRLGHTDAALADADTAAALMSEHGLRTPLQLLVNRDVVALRAALVERGPSLARDLLVEMEAHPGLIPEGQTTVSLSDRELVVLKALAATESQVTIAEQLYVSKNTVKSQLRSIYRKLGVGSREEALRAAGELKLIP